MHRDHEHDTSTSGTTSAHLPPEPSSMRAVSVSLANAVATRAPQAEKGSTRIAPVPRHHCCLSSSWSPSSPRFRHSQRRTTRPRATRSPSTAGSIRRRSRLSWPPSRRRPGSSWRCAPDDEGVLVSQIIPGGYSHSPRRRVLHRELAAARRASAARVARGRKPLDAVATTSAKYSSAQKKGAAISARVSTIVYNNERPEAVAAPALDLRAGPTPSAKEAGALSG